MKPLKKGDNRRIYDDVTVISGSDDEINKKVQALNGNQNFKVLKLTSDRMCKENQVIL